MDTVDGSRPSCLVDTHCHLNHRDFDGDGAEVLERASAAGVRRLLVVGFDLVSSLRAVELSQRDERLYAVIGIHPESAGEWDDDARKRLEHLYKTAAGRACAYGEIGLDYYWETIPRVRQRRIFVEQIAFAQTLRRSIPIIIHCRNAMGDVLDALAESQTPSPIVMHCFGGDVDEARACLDAGYYLGIGGVVTFKKSDAVRDAVAYAPIDRLLLETDCPYLAPQPWRGKRNEPSYLPAVVNTVALAKGLSVEAVAAATTANATSLFGLG